MQAYKTGPAYAQIQWPTVLRITCWVTTPQKIPVG